MTAMDMGDPTHREAIRTVLATYGDLVDAARYDELAHLFTPDASANLLGRTLAGRQAIVDDISTALSRYEATCHLIVPGPITLTEENAHVRATVHALHRTSTGKIWQFFGVYDQDFSHEQGTWSIQRHHLHGIQGLPDDPSLHAMFTGHPDRKP